MTPSPARTATTTLPPRAVRAATHSAAGLLAVALLAACGGSDGTGAVDTAPTVATTSTTAPEDFTDAAERTTEVTGSDGVDAGDAEVAGTSASPTAATDATTGGGAPAAPSAEDDAGAEPSDGAPTTDAPTAPAPSSIPTSIQGRWRESEADSVTEDECIDTQPGFEQNMGRVLEVRDDGFSSFETGGLLLEVISADATSVDAVFDTTYADTPTEDRLAMEVSDDDQVLTVTVADGGSPATRYVRCP